MTGLNAQVCSVTMATASGNDNAHLQIQVAKLLEGGSGLLPGLGVELWLFS